MLGGAHEVTELRSCVRRSQLSDFSPAKTEGLLALFLALEQQLQHRKSSQRHHHLCLLDFSTFP